ncbi:MAG: T9SS type A sorting domain-containing protein, partial [Bacteroidia bacterium]|nr:T9SS type A sorting domain-containing protein [Bacteroidia bacterium]
SGGVSPYTFIWSNGQTGATANNLVAGNYFVTVTGNNGCSSTATATISTAAAPTLSIGSTVSPCVGQATGIATVTASGGVSPYTFIWSNGQTGATANNLVAGNYFVTVTGNNGCTSNSTVILTDVPVFSVELTTNLEASGQTCQSNAVPQSGASPYTYLWSNGLTTQTASNLPSGQFSVSVTDASGCISIQTGSCMPVSANEIAGIEFFSITPNPAQSYLFIQIRLIQPEQLKMRFFNSIGQLLHENSYNSNIIDEVIDLNKYPSGCYFVQFTTHNGSKSEIITITR